MKEQYKKICEKYTGQCYKCPFFDCMCGFESEIDKLVKERKLILE